jgi:aconitate hydratase 2/2-methylisocitrate dehydratase
MASVGVLEAASDQIYQYLNFDKIEDYTEVAAKVPA